MFLPLHDAVPLRRIKVPYVTRGVIVLNALVFLIFQSGWLIHAEPNFSMGLGLIPRVIVGDAYLDGLWHAPTWATPITSLFLHGSWWHLASNMLFMWIFADNVEDSMGHARFVLFYLLCGAISGMGHAFASPGSESPLIGASGAISAVIGAYIMLHPRVPIFGLAFNIIPITLRAQWALGAWIVLQIFHAFYDTDTSIAWIAHLAGLTAGALLVIPLKAPDVPLFGRNDDV